MALNATNWTVWLTQPPVICALILLAAYWIGELMVFLLSPPPGQRASKPAPDRALVTAGGRQEPSASFSHTPPALPAPTLSPTDRAALRRLRERIRAGEVADGPTPVQRSKFARWLVKHGRFSEWDGARSSTD